jgi:hypothetical protein
LSSIGYIVDEIDGRYSVIQPDDVEKGDTITVSNMILSTVSELFEQQGPIDTQEVNEPSIDYLSSSSYAVLDKPPTTIVSKMDLFLSCLEKELAKKIDVNTPQC